jgi:hypothetical protein
MYACPLRGRGPGCRGRGIADNHARHRETLTMNKPSLLCARRVAAAVALAAAAAATSAAPTPLDPLRAGSHALGTGANAQFLKVDDNWHASSVLWNEALGQYGSGAPIGSFAWGTGVWGIADWQTAHSASPPPGMVTGGWSGRVGAISFGDERYNTEHGPTWGVVGLAPLFGAGFGQDNWTSFFSGYIRIAEAGLYNFSVLHDDGFFFTLGGLGQTLAIANDFLNPRERVGFASDLLLGVGLYAFTLGAYDRLEAGVVELAWSREGGDWTPVPTENLVAQVPLPATGWLLAGGLLALGAAQRRRR